MWALEQIKVLTEEEERNGKDTVPTRLRPSRQQRRGLVKKFYLLPFYFLAINGSVLKIGTNIGTFIYTRAKLYIDTFTRMLYICYIRSNGRFGTPETVKYP